MDHGRRIDEGLVGLRLSCYSRGASNVPYCEARRADGKLKSALKREGQIPPRNCIEVSSPECDTSRWRFRSLVENHSLRFESALCHYQCQESGCEIAFQTGGREICCFGARLPSVLKNARGSISLAFLSRKDLGGGRIAKKPPIYALSKARLWLDAQLSTQI
jgi:hypothetical protein